jgi:hypothetical protein
MNFVGVEVLKEAVNQLAPHIRYDLAQPAARIEPSVMEKLLNEAKRGISGDPAVPQAGPQVQQSQPPAAQPPKQGSA